MATYKPARGAAYNKKQAEALGRVLESLGEHVTPQQIVEAARPSRSPIHGLFEWDNTAAAEKYRIWQARFHVNHLEIVVRAEDEDRGTRAYHSVVVVSGDERNRGYSHMADIRRSPELAKQVIATALRELNGWKVRYAEYRDVFGEVMDAIDAVQRKAARRKRRRAA